MSDMSARAITSAEVSHVIVRGCTACGHPREVGVPCAGCGNSGAPVVHDLGVQSAYYRNPLRRLAWFLHGQRRAARRARSAN